MNCLYHHYFFHLSNVRTLFTRLLTVGYDSPWPLWAVRLRKEPVQYWHFFSRAIHGSSIDIKWCRFDVFLSKTTAILLASKCIIVIFVSFLLSILSIPFYDLKIIRTINGGHEIYLKKRIWQWIEYLHFQMYWWFRPSGIISFVVFDVLSGEEK